MAEKKGVGHAYNIDFLNVVFAASSLFLFVSVVWMVWDDFDREWKNAQRSFTVLEQEVTNLSLQQAGRDVDQNKIKQLEAQRTAGQQQVQANQAKLDEIQSQVKDLDNQIFRVNQDYLFTKATYDVDKYDYEVARRDQASSAESKGQHVAELMVALDKLNLELESLNAQRAKLLAEAGQYTKAVDDSTKQIDELTSEQRRLQRRLEEIEPSVVKTYFRDAPMLDFMAPTIKVRQMMLPRVLDDVNFTRVPKLDRCTTCHLSIDRKGYEKYPQPFTTHPNLSVYLGGDSPHPVEQIGCTVCHEGMGQSVSFKDASHMPSTEAQKEEWEEKYKWEEPHLWDYPMLAKDHTEASCAKCHKQEVFIPDAPKLNVAYATYERAGCYACHKTKGFENLRKPGPNLTRIGAKLTPDWVKTWVRNPRAVKPVTWMPKVWYNSNSSAPEDAVRNEVEINAAVTYLFENSEAYAFAVPAPPRGDAHEGEELVRSVGCLACHVIDEKVRAEIPPRRTFGQPLENIGNKTTYAWLYDWVRDPKHYSPSTYMPNLRLSDREAADVATYLSTLKEGGAGDAAKATPDQAAVDAVLLDYLKATMPFEEAKAQVGKLDSPAKQLALGKGVITRYGCFSCHEIKGFEGAQPIGVDLSEEGSKLVARLDFGFVELPHEKTAWFQQKLHDPRSFDTGRVLRPEEKLRMPDFGMSEEEASRLVTALMSFQREIQPPQAMPTRTARAEAVGIGRNLVHRRNCVACHVIEGDGGDYAKLVSDPTLGPPMLTPEGAKVQPDWLYAFLKAPITIRPWLDVRMPTFGLEDPDLNHVIRYFGAVSGTIGPFKTFELQRTSTGAGVGQEMFDLLRCQQCHVLGAIPKDQPTANLAPDLRMAPERLQPDWILAWLKNPAQIQPGTRMPGFWPDHPKSSFPQLGGDAEAQIRAIRDHIMTFKGGPSPKRGGATGAMVAADN